MALQWYSFNSDHLSSSIVFILSQKRCCKVINCRLYHGIFFEVILPDAGCIHLPCQQWQIPIVIHMEAQGAFSYHMPCSANQRASSQGSAEDCCRLLWWYEYFWLIELDRSSPSHAQHLSGDGPDTANRPHLHNNMMYTNIHDIHDKTIIIGQKLYCGSSHFCSNASY